MCIHGELAQVWRDDVCIHNDAIPSGITQNTRRTIPSFPLE
jgi:hypothetical protein